MHAGYRITRVKTAKLGSDVAAHEALAASVRRSIAKECARRVRVAKERRAVAVAVTTDQPEACFDQSPAHPTKSIASNREWATIYAQAMNVFLADVAQRLDPYAGEPVQPPTKKRVRFLLPAASEHLPEREPEPIVPSTKISALPPGLDEIIRGPPPKRAEGRIEQPFVTEMRACLSGVC